jgi:hypothetical protein
VGFAMGTRNTPDGRLGGFLVFLLTLGLGSMIGGAGLFIRRARAGQFAQASEEEGEAPGPEKPFARPWLYANIAGFLGGILAFLLLRMADMEAQERRTIESWFGAVVGLSIVSFSLRAIHTGSVPNEDDRYFRSRNPFRFWAVVALSLLMGIAVTVLGVAGIAK